MEELGWVSSVGASVVQLKSGAPAPWWSQWRRVAGGGRVVLPANVCGVLELPGVLGVAGHPGLYERACLEGVAGAEDRLRDALEVIGDVRQFGRRRDVRGAAFSALHAFWNARAAASLEHPYVDVRLSAVAERATRVLGSRARAVGLLPRSSWPAAGWWLVVVVADDAPVHEVVRWSALLRALIRVEPGVPDPPLSPWIVTQGGFQGRVAAGALPDALGALAAVSFWRDLESGWPPGMFVSAWCDLVARIGQCLGRHPREGRDADLEALMLGDAPALLRWVERGEPGLSAQDTLLWLRDVGDPALADVAAAGLGERGSLGHNPSLRFGPALMRMVQRIAEGLLR